MFWIQIKIYRGRSTKIIVFLNGSRVNWAPAFEGKSNNSSMTPAYLKAYRRFMRQVDESKTKTVQKLESGECIGYFFKFFFIKIIKKKSCSVFNNRRMLHGRNAFKLNGGVRHMEGTNNNKRRASNLF